MYANPNDQRNPPFKYGTKLPLRHIPSAHQFKTNDKIGHERITSISPRLIAQKENTLLDVASLWEQQSHKPIIKNKYSTKPNIQQYESQPIKKIQRRDSSRSKSPTTIPKIVHKPIKPLRVQQNFECQQILINRPTSIKPKVKEQINEITTTVKPTFFHKNLNSWQQQIAQFESKIEQLNGQAEAQQIVYLANNESSYYIDPQYLRRHSKLDWQSRAILIEWMMQVHTQFLLKRQTYHLSVNLADLYLSKTNTPVSRKNLQAIGSVCMYISSKIEEQQAVPIQKISKCSMNKYTCESLLQIQQAIVKTLRWNCSPTTIDYWASRIMQQWDLFVQSPIFTQMFPSLKRVNHPFFKKTDQISYKNYRQMMQLIDCSVTDIQTLQYKPRLLVCSFLYLLIGKFYTHFKAKQISQQFPYSSLYLLDQQLPLNTIYSKFLEFTFGIMLLDLLPSIQFCATFFILPMNFDIPNIDIDAPGMNTQQYVTFQTYNPYTISTIKQKRRDIAQ